MLPVGRKMKTGIPARDISYSILWSKSRRITRRGGRPRSKETLTVSPTSPRPGYSPPSGSSNSSLIESSTRWRRLAAIVVCLSVLLGGWLRLSGLDTKSITHVEIWVPGIRMPEGLSDPPERLTFRRVLTGTFSSDSQPPGFYLFMLPWTRIMGTSLRALRLPSALLGTASILLVYGLGALIGAPVMGAVAAALLAFSGHHVLWSKYARMHTLTCFLGLAATVLLLLIARDSRRQGILITGYVILILAGLTTHIFFWGLLATHMIWTFGNAWGRRELPDLCRAQLLVAVLGARLIDHEIYFLLLLHWKSRVTGTPRRAVDFHAISA